MKISLITYRQLTLTESLDLLFFLKKNFFHPTKAKQDSHSIMLCKMVMASRKKKSGSVPVYLNVYDLTPINGYAYWLGLGIYHSGVQGI